MKNLFILFLFFVLSSKTVLSQDLTIDSPKIKFTIYGGASLPQGDFGSSSIRDEKAGFGKTGFCAMAEGSKLLTSSTDLLASVSVSLNGFDTKEVEKQMEGSGFSVSAANYINTWAMTGVKYTVPYSEKVKIYGTGQIGILFSKRPDLTISSSIFEISETSKTKLATTFAYGFGAGVQLEKINIGLRYNSGNPEYKPDESGESFDIATSSVSILQLMIGFNF